MRIRRRPIDCARNALVIEGSTALESRPRLWRLQIARDVFIAVYILDNLRSDQMRGHRPQFNREVRIGDDKAGEPWRNAGNAAGLRDADWASCPGGGGGRRVVYCRSGRR